MNDVAISLTQAGEASTMVPMTTGTIQIVLLVSAVMFAIGMVGFLIRRNMISRWPRPRRPSPSDSWCSSIVESRR